MIKNGEEVMITKGFDIHNTWIPVQLKEEKFYLQVRLEGSWKVPGKAERSIMRKEHAIRVGWLCSVTLSYCYDLDGKSYKQVS